MTTQAELAASNVVANALPIVREASLLIADPQVRYVGTLSGTSPMAIPTTICRL